MVRLAKVQDFWPCHVGAWIFHGSSVMGDAMSGFNSKIQDESFVRFIVIILVELKTNISES